MKKLRLYKLRVNAEEDAVFLMSKGIATIIHGDAAPAVLEENFGKEPISISVEDALFDEAHRLLDEKYNSEPILQMTKWAARTLKGKHKKKR
ncbi:MAG: hypothetical protein LBP51_06785 [Deferribacteraceae bacterium]|jgi:hypothetical protein|nr:hypothetical protein [Deferribacteraceae bacterium]